MATPTWFFALVVVRRGDQFLMVRERKHQQTWYLPAGRVEPGETIAAAALRETLEETGLPVILDGILRIEHNPGIAGARVRVFFHAHVESDAPPKSQADEHTLEARWMTVAQMRELPLRGEEVIDIVEAVVGGAGVYPLGLLCQEGAGWSGDE